MSTTYNILPTAQSNIPEQKKFENQAATNTTETQKPGVVQQVYDGVSSFVSSTANALPSAGSLMPGAFSGPNPSQEDSKKVETTHTGGVGDLPGTRSEVDVVRLPEERVHPDPLSETHDLANQSTTRSRVDEATNQAYAAAEPIGRGAHDKFGGSNIGTNLDHQHGLGFGHRKDVQNQEAYVAGTAPTGSGVTTNTHDSSSTTQPSNTEYGFGKGVGGITHDNETRGTHMDPRGNALDPNFGSNSGGSQRTDTSRPKQTFENIKEKTGVTPSDHSHGNEPPSPSSPSSPNKVSMKDKLKGEMKVMTGKLTKDSEKVEEGKALKSGI